MYMPEENGADPNGDPRTEIDKSFSRVLGVLNYDLKKIVPYQDEGALYLSVFYVARPEKENGRCIARADLEVPEGKYTAEGVDAMAERLWQEVVGTQMRTTSYARLHAQGLEKENRSLYNKEKAISTHASDS